MEKAERIQNENLTGAGELIVHGDIPDDLFLKHPILKAGLTAVALGGWAVFLFMYMVGFDFWPLTATAGIIVYAWLREFALAYRYIRPYNSFYWVFLTHRRFRFLTDRLIVEEESNCREESIAESNLKNIEQSQERSERPFKAYWETNLPLNQCVWREGFLENDSFFGRYYSPRLWFRRPALELQFTLQRGVPSPFPGRGEYSYRHLTVACPDSAELRNFLIQSGIPKASPTVQSTPFWGWLGAFAGLSFGWHLTSRLDSMFAVCLLLLPVAGYYWGRWLAQIFGNSLH